MASNDTSARYFTQQLRDAPFVDYYDVVSAEHMSINIAMPIQRLFKPMATTFGQIRSDPVFAAPMRKALEVIGDLARSASAYSRRPVVRLQGRDFPRIVTALFKIPNLQGETAAWLLRIFWQEDVLEAEDFDTADWKEEKKQAEIRRRRLKRNLDVRLQHLFSGVRMFVCAPVPDFSNCRTRHTKPRVRTRSDGFARLHSLHRTGSTLPGRSTLWPTPARPISSALRIPTTVPACPSSFRCRAL
jgi:hypothetical protein